MIYYRVSDKSYPKIKLPGATKEVCFLNFLKSFQDVPTKIIADNCDPNTLKIFDGFDVEKTSLGNSGSFRFALDLALQSPHDVVYFVEDDYLHHPESSLDLIREGLRIADYVTLYDHPDKYSSHYDYGEISKVRKTQSSHWRKTVSTTMTFATTVESLKEDYDVWDWHTRDYHPDDHAVFSTLSSLGKDLVVCIPGRACHTDPTWGGMDVIEPWAVQMMIDQSLRMMCHSDSTTCVYRDYIMKSDSSPIDKLKMLTGLLNK